MEVYMKRYSIFILLWLWILTGASAQSGTMYVCVKSVELKASAGFFAESRGALVYGDQVTVLRENGKWAEVRAVKTSNLSGWVSLGALTAKRIIASSGGTSASASELALAGKGFSEAVENAYKNEFPVSYADIDAMETQNIPGSELLAFLREGHLNLGEN
jgi:hypothetical protein